MKTLDLAGSWQLYRDGESPIPGHLPGCTYLDYMANGMEDPFWGENETAATELAKHDYTYSRTFFLSADYWDQKYLDLVADGLDTLCTISINSRKVAFTDNINRVWRFDIRDFCHEGENVISLDFADPFKYIDKKNAERKLPMSSIPFPGVTYLRKTPCHFSWDWGPKLPPAGVTRAIRIESYDLRIDDIRIRQTHSSGKVALSVQADLSGADGLMEAAGELILTDPDGNPSRYAGILSENTFSWEIDIEDPKLWWCNGLGAQPLYQLDISITSNGQTKDSAYRQIGLRTISLDTSPDQDGRQFRFTVNGVPIFAKGADWIPADSFITRADRKTLFFYVQEAKKANMNMLRVWGGGMYESEDFYDACDENGILVWQDFAFACNCYPLDDPSYLETVRREVGDNVRRLRHRASLALWCGNNEIEAARLFKRFDKLDPLAQKNLLFFYNTLKTWKEELDEITPYWPGSPSSGDLGLKLQSMEPGKIWGDTHLWNIWHGMEPIEAFKKMPTRFCSEFGMESMPSMHTIRMFTDKPDVDLFDPVMQLHQKSGGGNEKMLYYLLAKYRNPARFEDFVYLSQIVQANTIRSATDCWRRNFGKQNGALFWQLNDCWPVASWAGIDYERQLKAVMYMAREFNKMLCLSCDIARDFAELFVVNDLPEPFTGTLIWTLQDFSGKTVNEGSAEVCLNGLSSCSPATLNLKTDLKGTAKKEIALIVRLLDQNGTEKDRKSWLLVPDKYASLPVPDISVICEEEEKTAVVTLRSNTYARYVYLEASGVTERWSDNYFDLLPKEDYTIRVKMPDSMTIESFRGALKIKTLMDVQPKNSLLADRWLRLKMIFAKKNYLTWLVYKLFIK